VDTVKGDPSRADKKKLRRRVSSVDVAKHAGVSQASVSRTFSRKGNVAEKTRQKVLEAAYELGYNPNAIARGLIQSSTNIIGVVMLRFMNPFYAFLLKEFTREFQRLGYVTMLLSIENEQELDDALPVALQYYVDGIIITSATLSSKMAESCMQTGTPVVLFNRYTTIENVNSVRTDNVGGGRVVADYLVSRGHRRIAYVAGEKNSSTNQDREKGFRERLQEHRLEISNYAQGDYTYDSGYAAAKELLQDGELPDAVFCANDLMALGLMDAARYEFGLAIPDRLAVVGFDDIPMASWPAYKLTSYHQPVRRLVEETIDVLVRAIADIDAEVETKLISGELIERRSSKQ
jgi:DNA-binding LacI/PurR family transcriptional regulator